MPETIQPARAYRLPDGRVAFVHPGLGGGGYGTFWRTARGALHRIKSPRMPMVGSRKAAQENLDAWALARRLPEVENPEGGDGHA